MHPCPCRPKTVIVPAGDLDLCRQALTCSPFGSEAVQAGAAYLGALLEGAAAGGGNQGRAARERIATATWARPRHTISMRVGLLCAWPGGAGLK